jgi:regulatory protein
VRPGRSGEAGKRSGKRKDVHERALGLLAARQRSRGELERRLVQAGFDADEVHAEIERLEGVGLIDDEAFARTVVESRMGARGESRRVVAMHLSRAGVTAEISNEVLDGAPDDDEARATRLAEERARRLADMEPRVAFQRLYGFLARRGYAPDVARAAARRALATDLDPD